MKAKSTKTKGDELGLVRDALIKHGGAQITFGDDTEVPESDEQAQSWKLANAALTVAADNSAYTHSWQTSPEAAAAIKAAKRPQTSNIQIKMVVNGDLVTFDGSWLRDL